MSVTSRSGLASTFLAALYPIALALWAANLPDLLPLLALTALSLSVTVALLKPDTAGAMRVQEVRQRGWLLIAVVLAVIGSPLVAHLLLSLLARAIGRPLEVGYLQNLLSESFGVVFAGYVIGRVLPFPSQPFAWVGATAYVLKRTLDSTAYESYQFADRLSALFRPGLPAFGQKEVLPWLFLIIGINLCLLLLAYQSGSTSRTIVDRKWWQPSSMTGSFVAFCMLALAAGSLYVDVLAISPTIRLAIQGLTVYGPGASRLKDLEGQVLEIGLEIDARNSGHAQTTLSNFSFSDLSVAGTAGSVTSSEYSITDSRTGLATDDKTITLNSGGRQNVHITFTLRQPLDGEMLYQIFRRIRLNQRAMFLTGIPVQHSPFLFPQFHAVDASGRNYSSGIVFLNEHYDPPAEQHVISEFWFNRADAPDLAVRPWDVVRPSPAAQGALPKQ